MSNGRDIVGFYLASTTKYLIDEYAFKKHGWGLIHNLIRNLGTSGFNDYQSSTMIQSVSIHYNRAETDLSTNQKMKRNVFPITRPFHPPSSSASLVREPHR